MARSVIEDRRELEIDDAKPSVADTVGNIAQLTIFMADAEFFEFRKQGDLTFGVELVDPTSAIGGDDFQSFRFNFEQSRNEGAAAFFKILKYAHLMLEVVGGLSAEDMRAAAAYYASL